MQKWEMCRCILDGETVLVYVYHPRGFVDRSRTFATDMEAYDFFYTVLPVDLLDDGWEPYHTQGGSYYFRRPHRP
jgi:hypothetical protein